MVPRWSTHDVSSSAQVQDLLARGRPVLITSRKDRQARYPDTSTSPQTTGEQVPDDRVPDDGAPEDRDGRQDREGGGGARDAAGPEFEATATVALVSAGVPVGILAYGWEHPRTFDSHDVGYLTAIASNTATAVDRCRLLERSEQVAEVLQRALLPDVSPEVPGWGVAAHYVPAVVGTYVGGDWYDAFTAHDGRLVLALGDVTGKGIRAATSQGPDRRSPRRRAGRCTSPHTPSATVDRSSPTCRTATPGIDST